MDQQTFNLLSQIAAITKIHQLAAKVHRQHGEIGQAKVHERKVSKAGAFLREVATDIELGAL